MTTIFDNEVSESDLMLAEYEAELYGMVTGTCPLCAVTLLIPPQEIETTCVGCGETVEANILHFKEASPIHCW